MLNKLLSLLNFSSRNYTEIKEHRSLYSKTTLLFLKFMFNSTVRMQFYEQLSALLKNGISRHETLTLMRFTFEKNKTILNSFWLEIKILDDMIYRIECGLGSDSLAEILDGLVPQSDITILSVDSKKGAALDQVISIISKFGKLKSEVSKMFIAPIIASGLIVVGIYSANSYIFPVLINIKPVDQFPVMTKNLYNFCKYFGNNFMSFTMISIIFVLIISSSLSRLISPIRNFLDKIPPYSIYKKIQAISFLLSLSMLLEVEVDFDTAIERLNKNTTKYLKSYLDKISDNISLGLRPGQAISTVNLFSKQTQIYIEILDKANALGTGMIVLSERSIVLQLKSIKLLMIIISSMLISLSILMALLFLFSIASFSFSF